jgi:hypothetical protein
VEEAGDGATLMSWEGGSDPGPTPAGAPPAEEQPLLEEESAHLYDDEPGSPVDEGPAVVHGVGDDPFPPPAGPPSAFQDEKPDDGPVRLPQKGRVPTDEDEWHLIPEEARGRGPEKPKTPQEMDQRTYLCAMWGYGRIKGVVLGLLMMLLLLVPVAESNGGLVMFWQLFSGTPGALGQGFAPDFLKIFLPVAGGAGLLIALVSLLSSNGQIRGFLQALFALAVPGFVVFCAVQNRPYGFEGTLGGGVPLGILFSALPILGLWGGFLFVQAASRINIRLPHKTLPRVMALLGAAALGVYFFVPGLVIPKESLLIGVLESFRNLGAVSGTAAIYAVLPIGTLLAFPVMALFALPTVVGFRGKIRSRLVVWLGLGVLLVPLVVAVYPWDQFAGANLIANLAFVRVYLLAYFSAVLFLVGISAFLGSMLIGMNYNEKMLMFAGD